MKQYKRQIWGILLSLTSLCALLLVVNLISQSSQIVYAHDSQEWLQQTNNPPREILVNNPCSMIEVKLRDLGGKDTENYKLFLDQVERVRFGDESSHYFKFWGKSGNVYKITTNIFNGPEINPVIGVDTMLLLYRNNPLETYGEPAIQQNDDRLLLEADDNTDRANDPYESEITYLAEEDRYFWIEVQNRVENGNGTYCLGIEFRPDLTTGNFPDFCEPNNSFDSACEIQVVPTPTKQNGVGNNEGISFNFKASEGVGPDLDYYKYWVKPGERYTCITKSLGDGNDTRMILLNPYGVVLGSNDDVTQSTVTVVGPETRKSEVVANVGYTGWLYIKVEPVVDEVNFEYGHAYTYNFECSAKINGFPIDSHQPPIDTTWDAPASSNSAIPEPAESIVEATAIATAPVVASKPEAVSFVVLPPRTPTPPPAQPGVPATFTLQIYYDQNGNQQKDNNEGVANVPVYLYTGLSETPIQALTSEGGAVFVNTETAAGTMQLFVPYLNINQEITVTDVQDIRLRVGSR